MKIPKFLVIIFVIVFLGLIAYVYKTSKSSQNIDITSTSTGQIYRGDLSNSIQVTGLAELANEQKLRFGRNGKISEIYTKVGDYVEKGQVLASLDKRDFYQSLKDISEKINDTQKDIAKEKEKAFGTEAKKMEREIASMERTLEKLQEELSKAIQNSPSTAKQKLIDLNAKKRDLESQKEKYKIDLETYETEYNARDTLIKSKTEAGQKIKNDIIEGSNGDLLAMRSVGDSINKIFGFNWDALTSSERYLASRIANEGKANRENVQNLWREAIKNIDNFNNISFKINKNSATIDDAKGLVSESIRIYEKFSETLDEAYRAVNSTLVDEYNGITKSEFDSVVGEVNSLKSTVSSKLSSLKTARDSLAIIESPEKIKSAVLLELQNKKFALETQSDNIAKLEIEIKQAENDIQVTSGGIVTDSNVSREILDKQSSVLSQEDAIKDKKEEYQKLISGKSDTLENLYKTLKNQQEDYNKEKEKEEDYEIRAPFAGTIRTIKIQTGDNLGQSSTGDNEKYILLENSDIINIKVSLNQLDIIKVKIGQEANVTFDAIPEANLVGTITEISSTPADNSGSGLSTYPIVVSVSREEYSIYSGMNANVNILLNQVTDVLLAPFSAISTDPTTGETVINILKNGNFVPTVVEIGSSSNGDVEIISGVEEGDVYQTIDFNANTYNQSDFNSGGFY